MSLTDEQIDIISATEALKSAGWKMNFKTKILNDANVTVIRGEPEELEKIYARLKEELPELCDA